MNVSFRPITDDDLEFLYRVYASTREEELSVLDWTEEQLEGFLRMQFHAQHTDYQRNYREAQFELILLDGEPIGRLYQDWRDDELRIIDIALLKEHRGKGIGGKLMREALDRAAAVGKCCRIHVECNNPAMHLYERLGFRMIEEQGVYYLMEWKP